MPDKPWVAGSSPASHRKVAVAQSIEQGTSRNPLSPRFIQNGVRVRGSRSAFVSNDVRYRLFARWRSQALRSSAGSGRLKW